MRFTIRNWNPFSFCLFSLKHHLRSTELKASIDEWVRKDNGEDGCGLKKRTNGSSKCLAWIEERVYLMVARQGSAASSDDAFLLTWRFGGFSSSLGTISMRKSNWSNFVIAMAISFLCNKKKSKVKNWPWEKLVFLALYPPSKKWKWLLNKTKYPWPLYS